MSRPTTKSQWFRLEKGKELSCWSVEDKEPCTNEQDDWEVEVGCEGQRPVGQGMSGQAV